MVHGEPETPRVPETYLHLDPRGYVPWEWSTQCLRYLGFLVQPPYETWTSSSGSGRAAHELVCEAKLRCLMPSEQMAPAGVLLEGTLVQLGVSGSDHVIHTRSLDARRLRALVAHGAQLLQGRHAVGNTGWQGHAPRDSLPQLPTLPFLRPRELAEVGTTPRVRRPTARYGASAPSPHRTRPAADPPLQGASGRKRRAVGSPRAVRPAAGTSPT